MRESARAALRLVIFVLHSGAYCAAILIFLPLFLKARRRRARAALQRRWGRETLALFGVRARLDGPPPPPGALLAANHLSILDIPLILAYAPADCVAKAELAAWPGIGLLCRAGGVIFVQRGRAAAAAGAVAGARERLGLGTSVLIFPEGTTTRGDKPVRLHATLLEAGIHTAAPVVACAVDYPGCRAAVSYAEDDTFTIHLWGLLRRPFTPARLEFLPVAPAADRRLLARAIERRINTVLFPATSAAAGVAASAGTMSHYRLSGSPPPTSRSI